MAICDRGGLPDDAVRHRDDRGESSGPREDAGRPAVATREAPLENRTALCLAPQLPPRGHPLGATRRELPGHGAARLCPDLAPGIYEIASSCVYCGIEFTGPEASRCHQPSWEHITNDARI